MVWKNESFRHILSSKGIKNAPIKIYKTPFGEYGNYDIEWKGQKFKQILTQEELYELLWYKHITHHVGKINTNEIEYISKRADLWLLQEIPLKYFNINAEKRKDHEQFPIVPPIILKENNQFTILDGEYRIKDEKFKNKWTILAYVGIPKSL